MKSSLQILVLSFYSLFLLTSCLLEEPKAKPEVVTAADQYEKILDDLIGPGSIQTEALEIGQKDTRVESIKISNSLERELLRRTLTVTDVQFDSSLNKRTIRFQSEYVTRNNQGDIEEQNSVSRRTEITVTPEGYYNFSDDGNEKTLHSWDFIIGLRGFCDSFETEKYNVNIQCSNLTLTPGTWQLKSPSAVSSSVPVRVLSLIRSVVLTDRATGLTQTSKLRYTVQMASGLPEMSKIVSYCSEGLQKIENQIYYLVRCNNLESL